MAANFMDSAKSYINVIDKTLDFFPPAVLVQSKTGVPKAYAAIAVGIVTVFMAFFNFAGQLVANVVGFLYPAYASGLALETPEAGDDKQWLTYWVVYGFFSVIEYFSDYLLSWFPFYYFLKLVILIWLYLPQTLGATKVYESLFQKLFHSPSTAGASKASARKSE